MNDHEKPGVVTIEETDTKNKSGYAPQWKVILHNDDKTEADFVTMILMRFFNKNLRDAHRIMLVTHNMGQGLCGVYPLEQAELRVEQTHSLARTAKFPLTLTMEKA